MSEDMTEVVTGGATRLGFTNMGRAIEHLSQASFHKFTIDVHHSQNKLTLTTEIASDEKNSYARVTAELARYSLIEDRGEAAGVGSRR